MPQASMTNPVVVKIGSSLVHIVGLELNQSTSDLQILFEVMMSLGTWFDLFLSNAADDQVRRRHIRSRP